MTMEALARNAWMMVSRGGLAILFGLALSVPGVGLPMAVVLFGVYAVVDGLWSLISLLLTARLAIGALAVGAQGLVSFTLGTLALMWPMVPPDVVHLVAGWGVVTGILEIIAAAAIPRERVGSWLLGTAGVSSVFLAILIRILPAADASGVVHIMAGYAIAFGAAIILAARSFRREYRLRSIAPMRQRVA